ncbi:MAG: response regulator [Treponema sp.]|nr:response regulator [Treponema sp.]
MNYRVLIVEDDPMVAMINSQFVKKVDGFEVAGMCRNGLEAIDFLGENDVDLILLDVYMPVMDGTDTLKKIRTMKKTAEVIMVTAANDSNTIEETVHLGVHDYLIKPFTFERFAASLEKFKAKKQLLNENSVMDQSCVDNLFAQETSIGQTDLTVAGNSREQEAMEALPKGIQKKTLSRIISYFDSNSGWSSTDMISEALGISIVTVRTYMNYLVKAKIITEDINYSTGGRPSMLYKKCN